jgi:hypothetical protein
MLLARGGDADHEEAARQLGEALSVARTLGMKTLVAETETRLAELERPD